MKSTAQRVLDAAENLFAEKGYEAASLGDVADVVGIRSPSLYNHFKSKEALYSAVVERLLAKFDEVLKSVSAPVTCDNVTSWLNGIASLHYENPNFSRLLQHAALSGGPKTDELVERMFMPLFKLADNRAVSYEVSSGEAILQPYAIMALNNMIMSYITLAPMYQHAVGEDLFSDQAKALQKDLIVKMVRCVVVDHREAVM